jgi:hypothetical protein
MTEKAKKNIVERINVKSSLIEIQGFAFISMPQYFGAEIIVKFRVNETDFIIQEKIDNVQELAFLRNKFEDIIVKKVFKIVAERIAKELIEKHYKEIVK